MTKIKIYTDEEKEEIWNKYHKKIHPYDNIDNWGKDLLIKYIYDLEEEKYYLTNGLNYYKNYSLYMKKAHIYKVELGRCVRKLTRIYKLFDEYILTAMKCYPIGSPQLTFFIECTETVRKKIKNV